MAGGSCGSGLAPGNQKFNYAQLKGLWIQGGGDKQYADIAASVAMAESSGNSTAYDADCNGSIDRGLWQINSVHGAQSTFDIMGNTRAAISISNNGRDWSPWVTFNNGAYRQFLQGSIPPDLNAPINGSNAAGNVTGTQLTSDPGSFLGPLDPFNIFGGAAGGVAEKVAAEVLKAVVGTILNPFIQIAAGILGMAGGSILMLGGAYMMVINTQYGQETKQRYEQVRGAEKQAALFAVAPEAEGAAAAGGAAGGGAAASRGGGGGFGSLLGGMRTQPTAQQRLARTRSQAATNEIRRRQAQQAKQMSTEQLLAAESYRYGGR